MFIRNIVRLSVVGRAVQIYVQKGSIVYSSMKSSHRLLIEIVVIVDKEITSHNTVRCVRWPETKQNIFVIISDGSPSAYTVLKEDEKIIEGEVGKEERDDAFLQTVFRAAPRRSN